MYPPHALDAVCITIRFSPEAHQLRCILVSFLQVKVQFHTREPLTEERRLLQILFLLTIFGYHYY